jgi:hypothetical protein
VDVHSSSEQKKGVKGPGSASKAESLEDETQGSSSEPKEIAKGSEASSESKETPQALSAEEIAEELHSRERMDRGWEAFEKGKAKLIESGEWASGRAKFNESGADWASLSATFDRAAKAPGAYQRIFDRAPEEVTRESSPLLTHVRDKFKKAKPTAVPRISLDQRLVDSFSLAEEGSLESAHSSAKTGNPNSSNEDAEMQGEGNQEVASAPKNPASESSAMSAENETLFIDRLVRLASNGEFLSTHGELSTHEEVLDVFLLAFGDHPEVSEDFVYNLTRRLANPPETPFETIIKDYQEK